MDIKPSTNPLNLANIVAIATHYHGVQIIKTSDWPNATLYFNSMFRISIKCPGIMIKMRLERENYEKSR